MTFLARFLLCALLVAGPVGAVATEAPRKGELGVGQSTKLPMPRFVSLKYPETNARIGPGKTTPIVWTYRRQGLPVEVIDEYEHWRRLRDSEGAEGWVHKSQIQGQRTALVEPASEVLLLRDGPGERARALAKVEPGALGRLERCESGWCALVFPGEIEGWLPRTQLYGLYDNERLD